MPRIPETGIHQRRWPTHRPPLHPLLVRTLYDGCAALFSAPEVLEPSEGNLLARQIDGDMLRYAHMCTPRPVGTVVCSHTRSCTGVLKTLAVLPGNHPIRLGPRGIEDGRGHEPSKDLTWEGLLDG